MTDIDHDIRIDNWNNGSLDAIRGNHKMSTDIDYLEGYNQGLEERKVRVVMPSRSEGYYHSKLMD